MKKTFSVLTALCCIISLSSISANASIIDPWRFSCSEGENGEAIITTRNREYGFLIVTDGTELETFNNAHLGQPLRTLEALPDVTKEWYWETDSEALLANYNENNRFYHVDLQSNVGWEKLSATARSFMLKTEGVVDVLLLESSFSGTPEWHGDFEIYYHNDVTDAEKTALKENMDISFIREVQEDYTDEDNIPDYDILSRAFAACDQFMEVNGELAACVDFIQPDLLIAGNGKVVNSAVSAWDGIGDMDCNTAIDATDAAVILKTASAAGSGAQLETTTTADVNADGELNALDAALVLQYAAYAGAGGEDSIEDFIKSL